MQMFKLSPRLGDGAVNESSVKSSWGASLDILHMSLKTERREEE